MRADTPKHEAQASVGAVIVAAGESRRMCGTDKVFVPLLGRPMISYSLQALNDCAPVNTVVLVTSRDNVERSRKLVEVEGWRKVTQVCAGGERRQDSVLRGLEMIRDTAWTVVHDGARPCVDTEMMARGLESARETGAAIAAVPVNDTIKSAGTDLVVRETLDRTSLWAVQTPQVFSTDMLWKAHRQVSDDVTDDAAMVERIGGKVTIFMGSYENIKVTSPGDIAIAEAILRARAGSQAARD